MAAVSAACRPTDAEVQRNLRRIRLDGTAKQVFETGRSRMQIAAIVFFAAFAAVGWRLVDVTLDGQSAATASTGSVPVEAPPRAEITDRNGVVLATSLRSYSLYARPQMVLDAETAAVKLAAILPSLDAAQLERQLRRTDTPFVWLHRHLTPRQFHAVNALGEPGLGAERTVARVYPHGRAAAHLLGFTDVDGKGIAGMELAANDRLGAGERVALSVDLRVQDVVRDEAQRALEAFSADGAGAVVMDVQTGEVLALSSLPDFDPNAPPAPGDPANFNAVTKGVYELGSTFKVLTTAIALDAGLVQPDTVYPIGARMKIDRFSIRDHKYLGKQLTVSEILAQSSNIGSAQIAEQIGTPRQRDYLMRMGMLSPAPIELVETASPDLPSPWRPVNTMTIGYGYGLAVTPLHLASGVATVANGGDYVPPTVLRRGSDERVDRTAVLSPQTSATMMTLMRHVVTDGTGGGADVPGYRVAGKTGTAEKSDGTDKTRLISSFVGVFPAHAPRYVVYVLLDEPKGTEDTLGYATGGWVAAPAVGRIVARIAPILGVTPSIEDVLPRGDDGVIMVNAEERGGVAQRIDGGR